MQGMRLLLPLLLVCAAGAQQSQTAREISAHVPSGPNATAANETAEFEVPCPEPPADCILQAGESATLPENPQPQFEPTATFWSWGGFGSSRQGALRSNRQAFHDKTWLITQGVWLAAISYDVEATHQGLAHHKCVEGNEGADTRPSRGDLYRGHIPEYAFGTVWNYVMLRLLWKPEIFTFPVYGGIEHFRDGSKWLTDCW